MSKLTIQQVKNKHQNQLLALPNVVGVGIGKLDSNLVIKVLVSKKSDELRKKIPEYIESYQVILEEVGEIKAH